MYLPILTYNIWSYLLWPPVIAVSAYELFILRDLARVCALGCISNVRVYPAQHLHIDVRNSRSSMPPPKAAVASQTRFLPDLFFGLSNPPS